jgi:hypothetical protein
MTTFKELAESLLRESGATELLIELDQAGVERVAGEDGMTGCKLTSFRFKSESGWVTVQAKGTRRFGEGY